MARKQYDPLNIVPSPDVVRQKLEETLSLAERLRILLELSERIRPANTTKPTAVRIVEKTAVPA